MTRKTVRRNQETAAAARGSVRKDDLVREIMANFGDTAHRNPMYRGVGTRRYLTLRLSHCEHRQQNVSIINRQWLFLPHGGQWHLLRHVLTASRS